MREAHLGRGSCTEDPWFLQWGFSRATGLKRLLRVYSRLAEPPLLLSDSEATFTRLCDLFCSHHYHCCCCSHHHHLLLLVAASDALHIPGSKSSDLFCRAPQLNSARIFYSAACLPNQGRSNQRERGGGRGCSELFLQQLSTNQSINQSSALTILSSRWYFKRRPHVKLADQKGRRQWKEDVQKQQEEEAPGKKHVRQAALLLCTCTCICVVVIAFVVVFLSFFWICIVVFSCINLVLHIHSYTIYTSICMRCGETKVGCAGSTGTAISYFTDAY